ncbi:MAG: hypothetical protein CMH75_06680 [Nitrospina sp.]|nr:hypothetical protein [Nitrospina sp.]|tara:strand:- start:1544 stop:1774 length:231 start_codon:yes stop_codon:yes gene_type:complete
MGYFYILFIMVLTLSCSANLEDDKTPQKIPLDIKKKSVSSLNTESNPIIHEKISGSGSDNSITNISGFASSRISGK